jgi:DNA-binding PadR family transcriptional regulator
VPARVDLTLTEAAVLGLLALEGERSGYDLLRLAQGNVGHVWAPAKSQLYATLGRLTRNGLVDGRVVEQPDRPDKQLFSLSDEGWARLQAWLGEVVGHAQQEQVLKLFLGGLVPLPTLVAQVERYRDDARERLAVFATIDATNTGRGHDFFHRLVLEHGIASAEATVVWAEETLRKLHSPAARRAQRAAGRRIDFARDGAGTA